MNRDTRQVLARTLQLVGSPDYPGCLLSGR